MNKNCRNHSSRGLTLELPVMLIQRNKYSLAVESDNAGVLLGECGDEVAWNENPLFMSDKP